jgi:hypothetical protein
MIPKLARDFERLHELLERLGKIDLTLAIDKKTGIDRRKEHRSIVEVIAERIESYYLELNLVRTQSRLARLNKLLETTAIDSWKGNEVMAELKALREALEDDLRHYVIFVPTQDRVTFYENLQPFGEAVHNIFLDARNDIREACNCYATDNFTACVFHLMRVAERGMRALAVHLKIKKTGKHPLEFAEWGRVCGALKKKVEQLQQRKGRSAHKSMLLQRYADAASQADYINEIWRKELAHTRRTTPYNQPEAMSVLVRVHEFMQSLAVWIPAGQVNRETSS